MSLIMIGLSGVAVFQRAILVTLPVWTLQDFALDQTQALNAALAFVRAIPSQPMSSADRLAMPICAKISDVRAIEPPTSMPRQAFSTTIASKPSRWASSHE